MLVLLLLLQAFDTRLGDAALVGAVMLMDMPSCEALWVAATTSHYQE